MHIDGCAATARKDAIIVQVMLAIAAQTSYLKKTRMRVADK